MLRIACPLSVALAAAWPVAGVAGQLTVERVDCKAGVRVAARDVPVSRVLQELSRQLGFKLKFEGDTDRLITADVTRPPGPLVAKLLEADSVVYDEIPDPKCPGQHTLAKVWVLPKGQDGPPPPRELTPMEVYRKAHGLPIDEPAADAKDARPADAAKEPAQ